MTARDDNGGGDSLSTLRCAACSARLAHDQRYCTECGARRGPLARRFAGLIGTVLEQGRAAAQEPNRIPDEADRIDDHPTFPEWMPAPRAAAVAILVMLAFGVFTGSLFTPTVESLARQLIVVVSQPPPRASAVVASQNGANSGGGSSQVTTTTTVTVGGSSAPAGSAAAPASTTPTGNGTGSGTGSGTGNGAGIGTSNPALHLPPIHHVFLIVLSEQSIFQTFSPVSSDHYLSQTLLRQGELIQNYYGVAGSPLANGVALISGQGPTFETSINCPQFAPLSPGTPGAGGQVLGGGCVYPPSTLTIADQLAAAHLTWRAYIEGTSGKRARTACVHPQIGSIDDHAAPSRGKPYVTWRNPFVYFSSLTDGAACRDNEVGLGKLTADLKTASRAPTLAYIIPSTCHDGSDQPCAPGAAAGLAPADGFLKSIVRQIKHSAAYKDNGLIAITFDEAPQTGPRADHSSCCATPRYPNLPSAPASTGPAPTTSTSSSTSNTTSTAAATTTTSTSTSTPAAGTGGPTKPTGGGGQVGLLLISPFVKPGSADQFDYYNHFSLLQSIEDLFGLAHLGFAHHRGLPAFNTGTYSNYAG